MNRKKIEVGFRYYSPRSGQYYTIIIKRHIGDQPYLGISDEGKHTVSFDEYGEDKWYECGGNFYQLDLNTKSIPKWSLNKV